MNKFPWMVAIMDGMDDYYCGGSIISDKWILTAAHCVQDEGDSGNYVYCYDSYGPPMVPCCGISVMV